MSPQVYLFALLTALTWGIGHIPSKRGLAAGGTPLQSSVIIVGVQVLILWILFLVLHKEGEFFPNVSLWTASIFALGGLFGASLGSLLLLSATDHVGASVSSAASNTRPLFAAAIAVIWLGESVRPLLFLGIVLVVAGVVVLVFSKGGDIRGWQAWKLWIPLSAAAAFAAGNVIRRFGLASTPTPILEALVIDQTAGFIALGVYAFFRKGRDVLSAPPKSYLFYSLTGVLGAIGYLALFEALDKGSVAVIDPLVATQPLFTTFGAYFLLGDLERITVGLVMGTILIVVGAGIIVLFSAGAVPV
jgi:drug/metabolite transporter, DME family